MSGGQRLRGGWLDNGLSISVHCRGGEAVGKGEPSISNGRRWGGGPAGMVPSTIHFAGVAEVKESERRL